jgi:hypothetical protein
LIGFISTSEFFLKNIIHTVNIIVDNKITKPDIITPATAIHFFCFLTKAIIPSISPAIANGIHNIAPIIVKDNTVQTILKTKLVVESHDF